MDIYKNINALVGYALAQGLIEEDDVIYTQNRLLELFSLDGFEKTLASQIPQTPEQDLEQILNEMLDFASEKNLFQDTGIQSRNLFDTKIMGCLLPRPSQVQEKFMELYKRSPKEASDWFYKFSKDSNYIRRYRVNRDIRWIAKTEYGDMAITINLSKPDKGTPGINLSEDVLTASKPAVHHYPECVLCKENVGYAGRADFQAGQNLRIIPLRLSGKVWGFQYSPFAYYNEHCVVFSYDHVPMRISRETFANLLEFIRLFPHYTIGGNADLPIVGGSILNHSHYQGGRFNFPLAMAPVETRFTVHGYEDVSAGIVKWPASVIRLRTHNTESLISLCDKILRNWRIYNDEASFIYSQTNGESHNTLTPIARMRDGFYEIDLVLRNNITTAEHPFGLFHTHEEHRHIKKENIGLMEVLGLAVLPGHLKKELSALGNAMIQGRNYRNDPLVSKHADWADKILSQYGKISAKNIDSVLKTEVGKAFVCILENSAVFKRTPEGKDAFMKFIKTFA